MKAIGNANGIPYYQQISAGAQKQLRNELNEYAMTFWTEIERYILENATTYTLYGFASKQNRIYKSSIDKIG